MSDPQQLGVTVRQLTDAGAAIVTVAEQLGEATAELSGSIAAAGDQGLAALRVLAECESDWERAINYVATKIGLAGDLLQDNAQVYATNEHVTTESLRIDWEH